MNWTIIIAGLIGVIYPAYFLLTYKSTLKKIKTVAGFKLVDYKLTIFLFWFLTVIILVNHFLYRQPDLNFYPTLNTTGLILSAIVLLFIGLQYKQSKVTPENVEMLKDKMKSILFYLPWSKKELRWFILLSISAGICEEIIFRLFLFEFLKEYAGLIVAFLLTNILFSLTHIMSGKQNMIGSLLLGILFTAIYYFTENIWISILLHMGLDVNNGLLGYKIMNSDPVEKSPDDN